MTEQEKNLSDAVYANALAASQAGERPTYAGTFEGQLSDIFNKIQNREPFHYDVNEDPLYQNYKDQYIQGGKLAMKDTMGQAAALTGGYGNTYGQQVGQQAYNAYLQNLSAVIPELYGTAFNKYQAEGDDLKDQYALAGQMRDAEYGRYRDDLGDWEYNQNVAREQEREDYNRRTAEDATAYARQQAEAEIARQLEQQAYARQQQAYANLLAVIKASGHFPSDAELAAAGMSRDQANALRNEFNRQVAAEQAAADLNRRETEARIANLNSSSSASSSSGSSSGGSRSGSSGGSSGGYYPRMGGTASGSSEAAWTWSNGGGSGDYYNDVNSAAVDLAKQAAANRGSTTNAGTLPIIQAVRSDDTLTPAQKRTITDNVVTNANANVNRSAMGSKSASEHQNMGGNPESAEKLGKSRSSTPTTHSSSSGSSTSNASSVSSLINNALTKIKNLFK